MDVKTLVTLILCAITSVAVAESKSLPEEVRSYTVERDICDHFRGEPIEGNSPEQIERRKFVADSLVIYCSGTDRRLAALKRRYKDDRAARGKLNEYEERIEETECN